jgi:hypothetical protein
MLIQAGALIRVGIVLQGRNFVSKRLNKAHDFNVESTDAQIKQDTLLEIITFKRLK